MSVNYETHNAIHEMMAGMRRMVKEHQERQYRARNGISYIYFAKFKGIYFSSRVNLEGDMPTDKYLIIADYLHMHTKMLDKTLWSPRSISIRSNYQKDDNIPLEMTLNFKLITDYLKEKGYHMHTPERHIVNRLPMKGELCYLDLNE